MTAPHSARNTAATIAVTADRTVRAVRQPEQRDDRGAQDRHCRGGHRPERVEPHDDAEGAVVPVREGPRVHDPTLRRGGSAVDYSRGSGRRADRRRARSVRTVCGPTSRGPASLPSSRRASRASGWARYSPRITPELSAIATGDRGGHGEQGGARLDGEQREAAVDRQAGQERRDARRDDHQRRHPEPAGRRVAHQPEQRGGESRGPGDAEPPVAGDGVQRRGDRPAARAMGSQGAHRRVGGERVGRGGHRPADHHHRQVGEPDGAGVDHPEVDVEQVTDLDAAADAGHDRRPSRGTPPGSARPR